MNHIACLSRRRILASAILAIGAAATLAQAALPPSTTSALAARAAAKPAPATVAPPDLPAMSAEQIVARNVTARGGLAAWKKVETLVLEGKVDAGRRREDGGRIGKMTRPMPPGEIRAELRRAAFEKKPASDSKVIQLPFQLELKRPLKSRLEIPFEGVKSVQVFDGVNGWKLRPYLGRSEVEPFRPEEAKAASDQQQLDGYLIDHAAKGTQVALDGTELVDGQPCYRLKLTLKNADVRHVWVDAKTFLEARVEDPPRHVDGKMRPVSTYFRDYRKVDGLAIPFTMETRVDGLQDPRRIVVERVAVNSPVADTRFAKP
jgi:hypothetical protein